MIFEVLLNIISNLNYDDFCIFRIISSSIYQQTQALGFQLRDQYLVKYKLNPIAVAQVYENFAYLKASNVTKKKLAKEAQDQLLEVLPSVSNIPLMRSIFLRLLPKEQVEKKPKEEFPEAPYAKTVKPKKKKDDFTKTTKYYQLVAKVINEKCQARFQQIDLSRLIPYVTVESEFLLGLLISKDPSSLLNHIVELDNARMYSWFMERLTDELIAKIQSSLGKGYTYRNTMYYITSNHRISILEYLRDHGPNAVLYIDWDYDLDTHSLITMRDDDPGTEWLKRLVSKSLSAKLKL